MSFLGFVKKAEPPILAVLLKFGKEFEMDISFMLGEQKFNFRVGALIEHGGRYLMARGPQEECYYSVGGRVKIGETLEQAVIREVTEETGVQVKSAKLAVIHENFFLNFEGIPYHEISAYFIIETSPELLAVKDGHLTNDGPDGEYLEWTPPVRDDGIVVYPTFLSEVNIHSGEIKHIVTRE